MYQNGNLVHECLLAFLLWNFEKEEMMSKTALHTTLQSKERHSTGLTRYLIGRKGGKETNIDTNVQKDSSKDTEEGLKCFPSFPSVGTKMSHSQHTLKAVTSGLWLEFHCPVPFATNPLARKYCPGTACLLVTAFFFLPTPRDFRSVYLYFMERKKVHSAFQWISVEFISRFHILEPMFLYMTWTNMVVSVYLLEYMSISILFHAVLLT